MKKQVQSPVAECANCATQYKRSLGTRLACEVDTQPYSTFHFHNLCQGCSDAASTIRARCGGHTAGVPASTANADAIRLDFAAEQRRFAESTCPVCYRSLTGSRHSCPRWRYVR